MANFKIALSAGHGKNTAGKRCLKSLDPNETREWVLNARIAEKVEKLLGGYTGWELLRVDDRDGSTDVKLSTRSTMANEWGADVYLSLHHNAAANGTKAGGIVVIVSNNPHDEAIEWQKDLYNALIAETGLKGNRSTPMYKANFHEVRVPRMPAILMELGFMDSQIDTPIILTEEYADKCAAAIVQVIAQRGKLAKKSGGAEAAPAPEKPEPVEIKVDYAQSGPSKAKAGTYKVKSSDGTLNLRAGAHVSKQLIEEMKNGDEVRCYGYYTGDWLLVVSPTGKQGFCHSGYLVKLK